MFAVGDDAPRLEQHHPIGERDRGRAVRDDERGATLHHLGQGIADLVFLGGIDGRGGVVEDQHPWVGEDGAGDGNALALTTGERIAAFADQCLVAVSERGDELVGARQPRRPFDVLRTTPAVERTRCSPRSSR